MSQSMIKVCLPCGVSERTVACRRKYIIVWQPNAHVGTETPARTFQQPTADTYAVDQVLQRVMGV